MMAVPSRLDVSGSGYLPIRPECGMSGAEVKRGLVLQLVDGLDSSYWPLGLVVAGVVGWPIFVMSFTSTRRFLALPAEVLSVAIC